jgi:hypothetical protein
MPASLGNNVDHRVSLDRPDVRGCVITLVLTAGFVADVQSIESPHMSSGAKSFEACGVRLSQPLEPGLLVLLDELPGGTSAPARVANCVPLGTEGKYWLVGLALEQPGNIWCIHPAPENWGVDSNPVAAAVPLPKKENEWPYSVFSSKGEAHPGRK